LGSGGAEGGEKGGGALEDGGGREVPMRPHRKEESFLKQRGGYRLKKGASRAKKKFVAKTREAIH